MASHFTVKLLPSSTLIGNVIGFSFGAAAKKKRERKEKNKSFTTADKYLFTVSFTVSFHG